MARALKVQATVTDPDGAEERFFLDADPGWNRFGRAYHRYVELRWRQSQEAQPRDAVKIKLLRPFWTDVSL